MESSNNVDSKTAKDKKSKKYLPEGFRISKNRLQAFKEDKDPDSDPIWIDICSELHVLATTRSFESTNWGKLIEFNDADGNLKTLALPMHLFAGSSERIRALLLDEGLIINPNRKARELLDTYIQCANPPLRVRCVDRIGWHSFEDLRAFVIPLKSYGAEEIRYQPEFLVSAKNKICAKGTLADWQANIADKCIGNSRLIFALSAAFAPPCLEPLKAEGGGIHFRGPSSCGKTTLLQVGGSVWGGGGKNGNIDTWRSTSNAIEVRSYNACDSLLCLDEINQCDPKEVGSVVYTISNGFSKGRLNRAAELRKSGEWKTLFLSSGEQSIENIMMSINKRPLAGQEIRILDVSADCGKGFGILETLNGFDRPEDLIDYFKSAIHEWYGTPIDLFLGKLVCDYVAASHDLITFRDEFLSLHAGNVSSQVVRASHRIAVIYAAGRLAQKFGILPGAMDIMLSCSTILAEWRNNRDTSGSLEEKQALRELVAYLERFGESKFKPFGENVLQSHFPIPDLHGYYSSEPDEEIGWYIFPEVFKTKIFEGVDHKLAQRTLKEHNIIVTDVEHSRYTKKVKIADFVDFKPMYCVKKSALYYSIS